MERRSVVIGLIVASLASGFPRAAATETVLASASFESDSAGAVARPDGPPTVAENVWDAGTYVGGVSEVVAYGLTKRYRLSDAGSLDEIKGIRLPFTDEVSSGTLVLEAVATAGQTDSDGGFLCLDKPDKEEWICGIGFDGGGNFRVNGSPTTVDYSSNNRYRFRITVHFGQNPTADFRITECATSQVIFESEDQALSGPGTAASMVFRTDADDNGAFTVDELSAVQ